MIFCVFWYVFFIYFLFNNIKKNVIVLFNVFLYNIYLVFLYSLVCFEFFLFYRLLVSLISVLWFWKKMMFYGERLRLFVVVNWFLVFLKKIGENFWFMEMSFGGKFNFLGKLWVIYDYINNIVWKVCLIVWCGFLKVVW